MFNKEKALWSQVFANMCSEFWFQQHKVQFIHSSKGYRGCPELLSLCKMQIPRKVKKQFYDPQAKENFLLTNAERQNHIIRSLVVSFAFLASPSSVCAFCSLFWDYYSSSMACASMGDDKKMHLFESKYKFIYVFELPQFPSLSRVCY